MKQFVFFIVFIILTACSDIKHLDKPGDFYGDDKMADILTDLYLMEATMTTNREAFTKLQVLPSDFIYNKYETDSTAFKENLNYYSDRVKEYQELMVLVEQRMDVLRDSISARQARDAAMKDKVYQEQKDTELIELVPDDVTEN